MKCAASSSLSNQLVLVLSPLPNNADVVGRADCRTPNRIVNGKVLRHV